MLPAEFEGVLLKLWLSQDVTGDPSHNLTGFLL